MKSLKNLIFFLFVPLFLFSCDPENLPPDLGVLNTVSETGDQEGTIEDKKN